MADFFPFVILVFIFPIAIAAGIRQQRKEKRRLEDLANALGARVLSGKITGPYQSSSFEIRYVYTGKHRRLTQVVVSMPFQGYPFRIRKENVADEILLRLSKQFQDFQTGDADFDKRFRISASAQHEEWMRRYTAETGRLDAMEWFFANSFQSVHSDGGRLHATYSDSSLAGAPFASQQREVCPIWDPAFIKASLVALEHAAKLDEPVPYDSWEEWLGKVLRHGLKFEGKERVYIALVGALIAWMGLMVYMASRPQSGAI